MPGEGGVDSPAYGFLPVARDQNLATSWTTGIEQDASALAVSGGFESCCILAHRPRAARAKL